jgi:hypothetical protein
VDSQGCSLIDVLNPVSSKHFHGQTFYFLIDRVVSMNCILIPYVSRQHKRLFLKFL